MTPVTYDAAKQTWEGIAECTTVANRWPTICEIEYDYIMATYQIVIMHYSKAILDAALDYLKKNICYCKDLPDSYVSHGKGPVPIAFRVIPEDDFYNRLSKELGLEEF